MPHCHLHRQEFTLTPSTVLQSVYFSALHYRNQPDNNLHPMGAEALVRWMHPVRGIVSPAQFIPVAK